jgi:membrane protein YdbS with pleckstrin-like domain
MFELIKSVVAKLLVLPIGPPDMPADGHASVRTLRASPRLLTYNYVVAAFGLVGTWGALLVLAIVAAARGDGWLWALAGVGAVLVFGTTLVTFVTTRLDYELRYYVVTDRSLRIREGALLIRELTLTFENVQNVSIRQGPLERLLGFANVVVETAGGASNPELGVKNTHQGVLRGVENAEEIRDLIRARLGQSLARAGLGDADDVGESQTTLKSAAQVAMLRDIHVEAQGLRRAVEARLRPAADGVSRPAK